METERKSGEYLVHFLILRLCNYDKSLDHVELGARDDITLSDNSSKLQQVHTTNYSTCIAFTAANKKH
jgi:hypothetical protein